MSKNTVHYDTLNEYITLWLSLLEQFITIHAVVYTGTVHYDTLNECVTLRLSILVQFITIHWMNALPCGCLYWYSSLRCIEWMRYLVVVYTRTVRYDTLNECVTLWLSILVQFITIHWMNALPCGCLYWYSSLRYIEWMRYLVVVYTGTVRYDTLNEYVTL